MYIFAKSTLAIEEMPHLKVKADKATTKYFIEALFKNCMIIVTLRNLEWPDKILKYYISLMSALLMVLNIGRLIIY